MSLENLLMPYATNKDTDQPVHLRSLISIIVIHWLDSIISVVSISRISRLASLCSWANRFKPSLVGNSEDLFSRERAHIKLNNGLFRFWKTIWPQERLELGTLWFSVWSANCLAKQMLVWGEDGGRIGVFCDLSSCAHQFTLIWAASWQNQQRGCVPSKPSDQPGHPPSLIRVFAVCSMGS